MNKCIICNEEIKTDSQFINGNWYHNNCIELMAKQNKAYKNMRKEAIKYCNSYCCWTDEGGNFQESDFCIDDLLNILNKVGGSDE